MRQAGACGSGDRQSDGNDRCREDAERENDEGERGSPVSQALPERRAGSDPKEAAHGGDGERPAPVGPPTVRRSVRKA